MINFTYDPGPDFLAIAGLRKPKNRTNTPANTNANATAPAPEPAVATEQALSVAVRFETPGVGDIWLVPDQAAAEKLGLAPGTWLTPADLLVLEAIPTLKDRKRVLRIMRETGGHIAGGGPWQ